MTYSLSGVISTESFSVSGARNKPTFKSNSKDWLYRVDQELVRGVPFLTQRSVWRSSIPRDGLASKILFGPLNFSSKFMITWVTSNFGSLFNSSKSRFWSRFLLRIEIGPKWKIRIFESWTEIGVGHMNHEGRHDHEGRRAIEWIKIEFSKQVHHLGLNSFIHFAGPKKGPHVLWPNYDKKSNSFLPNGYNHKA